MFVGRPKNFLPPGGCNRAKTFSPFPDGARARGPLESVAPRRARRDNPPVHTLTTTPGLPKEDVYGELRTHLAALFDGERNGLANAANMAAQLFQALPDLNWAGFYFLQEGDLVLGPFQGRVACVRIPIGRGVCGAAAQRRETVMVPDVSAFPGHIACDSASRSEIVVPLVWTGRLLGVLDLDSPRLARFDRVDADGLEAAVDLLLRASDFGRVVDETSTP
jgi:L-methionine (R)-S-oxide reductase